MIYKKICENEFTSSFDDNQEIIQELITIPNNKIPKEDYQCIDDFLSALLSMDNSQNADSIADKKSIQKLDSLLNYVRSNRN